MYIPDLIRKEGLRRGLSYKTIKTYNDCVRKFFSVCRKQPNEVKKQDIKDFLDKLIERHRAGSTINVYLNALNFFYREVMNRKLTVNIRYSKTPKHKLMAKLIYSAGLRVSELVHLKRKDLELDGNLGWVRKGKGNKDRPFIIAESIRHELAAHISTENIFCPVPFGPQQPGNYYGLCACCKSKNDCCPKPLRQTVRILRMGSFSLFSVR